MRASRIGLIGAVLAATAAISIVALPAAAAEPPAAPYNVLTQTRLLTGGNTQESLVFAGDAATFTSELIPAVNGVRIRAVGTGINALGQLAPMTGTTLTTGTFPAQSAPSASAIGLLMSGFGISCTTTGGSVTISELVRDAGTQAVTALAATYSITCSGGRTAGGEIRYQSSLGYVARAKSITALGFGSVSVGYPSATKSLTVTSLGSQPLVLGTVAVTGANAADFPISADGCSGQTLAFGAACTVEVRAQPTALGARAATLVVPDNTAAGSQGAALSVLGTDPYSRTASPSVLTFEGMVGNFDTPQNVTVTLTGDAPLTVGPASVTGSSASAFTIVSDGCVGVILQKAQSCVISVRTTPPSYGYYYATLVVPDNAPGTSGQSVPLQAIVHTRAQGTVLPTNQIDFGVLAIDDTSPVHTVTLSSSGVDPLIVTGVSAFGYDTAGGIFTVTRDTCSGHTLAPGATCEIGVTAKPRLPGPFYGIVYIYDNYDSGANLVGLNGLTEAGTKGTYYPLAPTRILDTRIGLGAPAAQLGPNKALHLQVGGLGGVPAVGAGSVVLNVTVTGATNGSYLSLYPTGLTRPNASSLNFAAGWTGANSVTVGVGSGGKVDVYNAVGSTHVVVDIVGFYSGTIAAPTGLGLGGQYQPFTPMRLIDTRVTGQRLHGGDVAQVGLDFGAANPHIKAYAVTVTAVKPSGSGYLAAWNGVGAPPTTSTLNYTAGRVVPNFAIVPTAACADPGCPAGAPLIGVYVGGPSTVDLLVDVVGVYDDSTIDGGLRFAPINPTRIVDSRSGVGGGLTLGPNTTRVYTSPTDVTGFYTRALATNVTAVKPTTSTFLSLWPADQARPEVSNLNPASGQTVPNAAIVGLDQFGQYMVYNSVGSVDVLVDVVGRFIPGIVATPAPAGSTPTFRDSVPGSGNLRPVVIPPLVRHG